MLTLLGCDETDLLKAVLEWGEHQAEATSQKLADVLTPKILDHIRFPFVDVEVLVNLWDLGIYDKQSALFHSLVYKLDSTVCVFLSHLRIVVDQI